MYATANQKALIAIDSDFDYLAADANNIARQINANPYVLQTLVYSVESFNLSAASIDFCLAKTRFMLPNPYLVGTFVSQYSKLIYPVLAKYLYLLDHNVVGLMDAKAFHQQLTAFDLDQWYFGDDWLAFDTTMSQLNTTLTALATQDQFNEFEIALQQKGLTPSNSYQFIGGHVWEDKVVKPLVAKITNRQTLVEFQRIKEQFASQEINKRKNEMNHHFEDRCRFDTLVACCELKKQDPFYLQICAHLTALAI